MFYNKSTVCLGLSLLLMACAERSQQREQVHVDSAPQPEVSQEKPSQVVPSTSEARSSREIALQEVVVTAQKREGNISSSPVRLHKSMSMQDAAQVNSSMAASRPLAMIIPAEPRVDREKYQAFAENNVKAVRETPVSTFSIDVDTAAYSNIRRMLLKEGRLPPKDAVKLEEMINYFSYDYQVPDSRKQPFSVNSELAPAPWNDKHYILQIGLKGFEPEPAKRPPSNLVFLVDVSGSMRSADKLGLVKKSLRLLVNQMMAEDSIALVVYAGAAGLVLDATPGDQRAKIMAAIDGLTAGGSTNGGAGIQLAYSLAEQHFIKGGINRVIIASDGDMNVGTVDHEALKNLIERKRNSGIALTTLGYGSGNYNYALMEQLADVGNGNAAYIDNLREANKVLVQEMQSTLLTIAKDVKIQVEFNPALVSEYRLLGYENRLLNREDFRNDKVDAGEIGAGHTVTALYEIVLVGSKGEMIPPSRYQSKMGPQAEVSEAAKHGDELAFVRLRYKAPEGDIGIEFSQPVGVEQLQQRLADSSEDFRFAVAVAGFGQLLRGGKYMADWQYADLLNLARRAKGEDKHGYRGELIGLLELAQSLSPQGG